MIKFWKIAGIATLVAVLAVAAVGAVALAQDSGNGTDAPFNFAERLHEAIADALGISVETYDSAVDSAQKQVLGEAVSEGVLTQDQADQIQERMDQGFGLEMHNGFFGMREGWFGRGFGPGGFPGGAEHSLMSVAAEKLGMTVSDLATELQGGKSIADVASEQGVDTQVITGAYLDQLKENLDQAVADGRITQEKADLMYQQAEERVPDMLNSTFEGCGHGGFRGGMRPGRFESFPGQDNA
jgi:hypothetical protein